MFKPKNKSADEQVRKGTGTFRAQDLSFPSTNSPYGELSFPRLFVPGERKFLELSFLGPFVPGNFNSRGTKVPGNFRSTDLSFSGTFVPPTILQSISCELQTAVTTDRILCHRPMTGNESSWELSFQGNKVPRNERSRKVPWNFRSPRTKVPRNERS